MSMVLDTLITDKTASDLANDTDRTYIVYTNLNRVGQACTLLAELLHTDIRTKKWGMKDFRTNTEMTRLSRDTRASRTAYFTKTSMPVTSVKTIYSSVYQASDIEQVLKDLGGVYDNVVSRQQRLSLKLGAKVMGNRK